MAKLHTYTLLNTTLTLNTWRRIHTSCGCNK